MNYKQKKTIIQINEEILTASFDIEKKQRVKVKKDFKEIKISIDNSMKVKKT